MKVRKTPTRTCVTCRESSAKRELVRVVRTTEGDVHVDPSGKANGRGAYVCPSLECFETAVKRKRLQASLHVTLTEEDVERLRYEFERLLSEQSQQGR